MSLLLQGVTCKSPNILFILSDDTRMERRFLPWQPANSNSHHGQISVHRYHAEQLLCKPCLFPHQGFHIVWAFYDSSWYSDSFSHGNDASGLNLSYTLFPEQLKKHYNYSTYMVGKWHLGMKTKAYLPSSRGFDKFYGFYLGASDYWKHYSDVDDNGEPGLDLHQGGVDFNLKPGKTNTFIVLPRNTPRRCMQRKLLNGLVLMQGNARIFHGTCILHFKEHILATTNFCKHLCTKIEEFNHISPNETCGQYDVCSTTPTCTKRAMRKTCAATLAVVDDAIRNIVEHLKSVGMYENTIIIYSSDNGGPADGVDNNMMNNYPLRSGKGSTWEVDSGRRLYSRPENFETYLN